MQSTKIIRIKELESILGFSRSTIKRLEKAGLFPQRITITDKLVGWREEDIQNWIKDRPIKVREQK